MVTVSKREAGFSLAQLVLSFREHWHVSPEAGSVQGTPPQCLAPFWLPATDLPSSQLAPQLLTRNRSLSSTVFTHPES